MSGIVGLVTEMPRAEAESKVSAMIACMVHESFYTQGMYSVPELGAYFAWVDHRAADAHPPFLVKHKNKALIFAGEHFGSADSASQQGYGVDGRALLSAYEAEGDRCLRELNGWFAGVVIDRDLRKIVLFNDRFGIHHIYHAPVKGGVAFASEAKAILAVRPESRRLDPGALGEFVALGCVFGERTLFHDIGRMPGGSAWTLRAERPAVINRHRYFTPAELEAQVPLAADEYYERLRDAMEQIVPKYFAGAAPTAVSLTGGFDSRVIMANAGRAPGTRRSYTYGGMYRECFDVRSARAVATAAGFEHEVLPLDERFLAQFPALAEKTVWVTDGTADISVSHEIYLSRLARAVAPVRITGNYGSEVFRRVTTFKPLGLRADLFTRDFLPTIAAAEKSFRSIQAGHPTSFAVFHEIPSSLYGRLAAGQTELIVRSPFTDNTLVALAYQAPSGPHSVTAEWVRLITERAPQLALIPTDRRQLGTASGMGAATARLVNQILFKSEWYYDGGMPSWAARLDARLTRQRRPPFFAGSHKIQHYRLWFRDHFDDYLESLLSDTSHLSGYLDVRACQRLVTAHRAGAANYAAEITTLATIVLVNRLLISQRYPVPATPQPSDQFVA